MENFFQHLSGRELLDYKLQKLFRQFGYKKTKLSKFDDYELFASNKKFMNTSRMLTFTDTAGKLYALRPDVTLSILKRAAGEAGGGFQKLFYFEDVFRLSKGSGQYEAYAQIGAELIGPADLYSSIEVVTLARKALAIISPRYILSVSHMGFFSGIFDGTAVSPEEKSAILGYVRKKNTHDLERLLQATELPSQAQQAILAAASLYGPLRSTLEKAAAFAFNDIMRTALGELEALSQVFGSDDLQLDFSIVNDMDYYNGLVFQGYIESCPKAVLSGGRYDRLVERFVPGCGAIGFAIYADHLSAALPEDRHYDCDILILYKDCDFAALMREAEKLLAEGYTLRIEKQDAAAENYTCRKKYRFQGTTLTEEVPEC